MGRSDQIRPALPQARSWAVTVIGLAIVLGALSRPANAGVITLSGSFTANASLTPTGTPGVFMEVLTGPGADASLGSFTVSGTANIDFSNPPTVLTSGMLDLEFLNGGLSGASSGTGTGDGHGSATFVGTLLVQDGTGAFEGFQGTVNLSGTITLTSSTSAGVSGSYTGTIGTVGTVPEPTGLVLMGAGCGFLALGRAWRSRKKQNGAGAR